MTTMAADIPDIPCPDCKGAGGGCPSHGNVTYTVWYSCTRCGGTGRFTPLTSDVPPPWFGDPDQWIDRQASAQD